MVFELNKALHLVTVVKRYIPTRADTYQIFSSTLHMRQYGRLFVDFSLLFDLKNQIAVVEKRQAAFPLWSTVYIVKKTRPLL